MAQVKVGKLSDFPVNDKKRVTVNGQDIMVTNLDGKLYAIGDVCTHEKCSLAEGILQGDVVTCHCHYAQFDVRTGKVLAPPAEKDEPVYEVKVVGDEVFIVI